MTTENPGEELFALECEALGPDALLVGFRGREAMSQTFSYEVWVTVPVAAIPEPGGVLRASLAILVAGGVGAGEPMATHGLIAAYEVIDETAERALLRLEVRPRLWFASLSEHGRVFTERTVGAIAEEVLTAAGVTDRDLRLGESYPARAHVSQYKESDLAFLERLLEHEGIHYFFTHTSEGHTLVLADGRAAHAASRPTPVAYQPVEGGDLGSDLFVSLVEHRRLQPKVVRLTDYDPEKPSLVIEGEEPVGMGTNAEVVVHAAGAADPEDAARLAKVRKEELLSKSRTFEMTGTAFHLRAGTTFEVSGHPREGVDGRYLCTELEHVANARVRSPELARLTGIAETQVYDVRVRALAADVTFRPERAHRRPCVPAFERGSVDGPSDSEYAQLDDDGRYRVKLAFDETTRAGEAASVRTRMLQPHAGNPEGWHMPLRKDTEVLVGFLGGDPDRPVIAGAVPNAETPSVVTSANPTRNIFHTGGDNHLEIEDADGKQWFDLRTPTKRSRFHAGKPHDDDSHFVVLKTDADARFTIGGNQDVRVGGNLTEEVKGDVVEDYRTSQTSTVVGPQDTLVLGAVSETYQGGHDTEVTGAVNEVYCSSQTTTVSGVRSESYLANQQTLVAGSTTHTYDSQSLEVVGAASLQVYNGPKTITVPGACSYNFDGSVTQMFGPTTYLCPTLDLVTSSASTIFTPRWTTIYVSTNTVNANRVSHDSIEVKSFTLAIQLVFSIKAEAVGASLGKNTVKASASKFGYCVYGAKLTINGASFKNSGELKLDAAPLHKDGF